jgi:hypothetical protein
MTKFTDAKDPGYQRVSGELWIWVRDLKKRHEPVRIQTDPDPTPSSTAQPLLLTQGGDPDGSTKHYYMGSMHNVGHVFQGTNNTTFNFEDR